MNFSDELLHREDCSSREHVKHRLPDLVRENGERLPFAVLFLNLSEQLRPWQAAEERSLK